ncbi:hypothetical protein [Occallatibacter riparius]|uniref:Uncharacterized protein n=1 Tax=Occallatibacter riparius TaxID=1002689 RepID=A0A9J7BX57_9BACT|nr:hypothetical protein [Occallatibacter riparius]UWZ87097.1 hypothetical protein MOP44_11580 [Occallatibacter riparius]
MATASMIKTAATTNSVLRVRRFIAVGKPNPAVGKKPMQPERAHSLKGR